MPPAARITDPVVHPLPPVLQPGPGSSNVIIGMLLAWRGLPLAMAGGLQAAKKISDTAIEVAEKATLAAAGTPAAPAAKLAEETAKATAAATMGTMISGLASASATPSGGMTDIHACVTPLPVPPHGPGVVIDGSPTVLINGLPACRQGDTIIEAVGPPNKIAVGCPTVLIGNTGSGSGFGGSSGMSGGSAATSDPSKGKALIQEGVAAVLAAGAQAAAIAAAIGAAAVSAAGEASSQAAAAAAQATATAAAASARAAAMSLTRAAQAASGLISCGPGCECLSRAAGTAAPSSQQ